MLYFRYFVLILTVIFDFVYNVNINNDVYTLDQPSYVITASDATHVMTVTSLLECGSLCTSLGFECLTYSVVTSSEGVVECRLSRKTHRGSFMTLQQLKGSDVYGSKLDLNLMLFSILHTCRFSEDYPYCGYFEDLPNSIASLWEVQDNLFRW